MRPPENESPFGHKLLQSIENLDVENLNIQDGTLIFEDDSEDEESWYCRAAAATGYAHFTHKLRDLKLVNQMAPELPSLIPALIQHK